MPDPLVLLVALRRPLEQQDVVRECSDMRHPLTTAGSLGFKQVPGLAAHGLTATDTAEVVAAAQRASSMRGNPLDLTDDEVAEILDQAR